MKNKKLVMQGVLLAVGVLSLLFFLPAGVKCGIKETKAENIDSEQDVITIEEHINMKHPQLIIIESETETEIKTEEVIMAKPYNYYRVNDNGSYTQLDLELQDFLWEMCVKYDISGHYELIMAQMFSESCFKTDIISTTNDYGLMQINVCNHAWLSEKLGSSDFNNPYVSIEAGCLMMSMFLHKYDEARALVAYNSGESVVKKGTSSTKYSDKVLSNMSKLEIIEEE